MAATNITRVIITGKLTSDPELRGLASGTQVCKLRIAVNTRRKGADGGLVIGVVFQFVDVDPQRFGRDGGRQAAVQCAQVIQERVVILALCHKD